MRTNLFIKMQNIKSQIQMIKKPPLVIIMIISIIMIMMIIIIIIITTITIMIYLGSFLLSSISSRLRATSG